MNRLPFSILLVAALGVPLTGCGTTPDGYPLTSQQQSALAFAGVSIAFAAAEAIFVVLEKDGVEHIAAGRAAWGVVQAAIQAYLEVLQSFNILTVPEEHAVLIEEMNARAVALGVETEDTSWLRVQNSVYAGLDHFRGTELVASR